ncbi:MAG: HAMP domain-containing histidine kinase [Elusimicrobia bacterium]|nr:HAMP domain-containing histidine kinase [Elusimicrobiota bacterium]
MEEDLEQKTTAYLTHELRAPLTAIRCALDLIQEADERLTPESREYLVVAQRNAERLKRLIDDILDLSKLQAGRMSLFPLPCDPGGMLREAVESLRPWALKKGISLSAECGEGCPVAEADPRRIVQILTNLISNAIKFTPEGGKIAVRAESGRRDDAGYAVFSVRDTGCGIPEAEVAGLFRFFSQAGSAKMRAEGTGLGLALSRALVEMHGGDIRVQSRPGEGSLFSFTIPAHIPLKENTAAQAQPAAARKNA